MMNHNNPFPHTPVVATPNNFTDLIMKCDKSVGSYNAALMAMNLAHKMFNDLQISNAQTVTENSKPLTREEAWDVIERFADLPYTSAARSIINHVEYLHKIAK